MGKNKKRLPVTGDVLPDGVAADNATHTAFSHTPIAPDTATPHFADAKDAADASLRSTRSLSKNGYPKKPPCGRDDCNAGPRCDLAGCYRHPVGWKPPSEGSAPSVATKPPSADNKAINDLDWRAGLVVALLVVAMGAIFLLYNPRSDMPLCSEQPEWNQYNCRAG